MRTPAVLVALCVACVALAGCSDGGDSSGQKALEGKVGEDFQLREGRGAIVGLLVDDRFRPIHLSDEPRSAQVEGFVLLKETGQEVTTSENGEFSFVDLEPGMYELRATVAGHEALPQTVTVTEGVFAEATLVARREVSADGSIITQEFTVFKACEATLVVIGGAVPCTLDLSGDTDRDNFDADYSGFNATYLVTEFLANQQGFYEIRVRNGTSNCGGNFAIEEVVDGRYLKIVNQLGVAREENPLTCGNVAWNNTGAFNTIMFVDGIGKQEGLGFGAGVFFAIEGKFVQSVFVGKPERDVESYCVLCG